MSASQKVTPLKDLQALFSSGTVGGLSDAQLLDRFVLQREEAVFEAILDRHGAMVWGVCRGILRDHHDAEDAFQATFLILARKAASVSPREKLGNWLYGVARQTAMKARAASLKRRAREKRALVSPEPEKAAREADRDDALPLLHQELNRLPEKYRVPIVLCDLGGKTHKQAAEQLGWPVGTVSGRLSRARAMLAERLTRRGVTLAGGSLTALLSGSSASAGAPTPLITSTTRAATKFAAGRATAEAVSVNAAALAEGVLKGMLMTKLKIAAAALVAVALGTTGARSVDLGQSAEASSPAEDVAKTRPEAIQSPAAPEIIGGPSSSADEELKKLEGTWAITDMVEEGVRATTDMEAKGFGRVVIKSGKMTIFYPHDQSGLTFTFDVDPSQSPKIMGMILLNDKGEEDLRQPILLGIYELEGDTLTICFGRDRPDRFEVEPGSKQNLLVLKWAKR